ncbi:hypothetical protein EV363DRAFT_1150531 [Boletus edulis]|nr:hypothetical protein EV363DRAFT_1150531 [Boletus edulis]
MRFTKPTWVMHNGLDRSFFCYAYLLRSLLDSAKDTKRLSIFFIHIATGGLDTKYAHGVPNPSSTSLPKAPIAHRNLSAHPVCTRDQCSPHSGRWLASNSDDEIIIRDP